MTLSLELALIGSALVVSALPAVLILAIRARRERKAAYKIAQAERIVVPHPSITLYQNINRMGGRK